MVRPVVKEFVEVRVSARDVVKLLGLSGELVSFFVPTKQSKDLPDRSLVVVLLKK